MFKNNKYTVVIFLSLFSSRLVFSIELEDLLVSDALSKPCLSVSVQEADLMSCVSKGYMLAINERNDLLESVFYVISIRELARLKMISLLSY